MDLGNILKEEKLPTTTFNLCTFNCHGLKSNIEYTKSLILSHDITFICEHWLSKLEHFIIKNIYKNTHSSFFHQANKHEQGRPFGGNAFFIRKHLFQNIIILYEDDHIFAINLKKNQTNIIIIGIYLSSSRNNQTSLEEYKSQLDIISGIINNYEGVAEFIVLGDFQSFPHEIYDFLKRASYTKNNYSVVLSDFIKSNELELVDVTKGSGPKITYRHNTLPNASYIDHIALSRYTSLLYSNCFVIPFLSQNMSDHLPVSIEIGIIGQSSQENNHKKSENYSIPNYAWNNNDFLQLYNNCLNINFNRHNFTNENYDEELIKVYTVITKSASEALSQYLFGKKPSLHSKSWWTPELSRSKDILSFYFKKWRENGFLKDLNSQIFIRYRMARKNFRNAIKNAQNKNLYKKYIKIEKLKNTNPKNFWNTFKNIKNEANSKLFTINNKKDKDSITKEFANSFENRLNTKAITYTSSNFEIPPCTKFDEVIISDENIKTVVSRLKLNKSKDAFGISAEHLKNASCEALTEWLRKFFNFSINHGQTPKSMSTSLIIPLAKSYKKSLTDPNNYRGISIIPIFTKLMEYLILLICPEIKETHPLQFGFTKNSSTLHAEFVISETIKHYNNNNSPVYLCSLDAEKAFDSCNWDILFERLYNDKKLPLYIVNTISSLYYESSASVSYLGCKSYPFYLTQGVRQGSILSPYLYNIYTENLLDTLQNESTVGTSINGNYTGVVAYADDIILLSSTLSGLQKLLNTCNMYTHKNCIKLNADKTEFLLTGKKQIKNCTITLNNKKIKLHDKLNHLGFTWDTKSSPFASLNSLNIDHRISNFRAVIQTLIQSGIRFAHPNSIVQLYKTLAVPTLTYGLELCEHKKVLMQKLDIVGRNALKSLLNVSKHSKNYIHPLFFIEDISITIQQNKLNLFIRLMNNKITFDIIKSQPENKTAPQPFLDSIKGLCNKHELNLEKIIQSKKKIKIIGLKNLVPETDLQTLKCAVECWNSKEQRTIFKDILEKNIPR
ncbi:uncharacterized protein LOC136087412 [Hydra vulgaris]|uniref:Uncharacterized protein LOC136087412 n=1 Tax=Hydra vulgaris TaxID=6087 RepID=A0ABM4CWC0_HYDVU